MKPFIALLLLALPGRAEHLGKTPLAAERDRTAKERASDPFRFPCDPTALKAKVTFTLIPEFHGDQPMKTYRHYFEKLKSGEAWVAYEAGLEKLAGLPIEGLSLEASKRVRRSADGLYPVFFKLLDTYETERIVAGKRVRSTSPERLAKSLLQAGWVSEGQSPLFSEALTRLEKKLSLEESSKAKRLMASLTQAAKEPEALQAATAFGPEWTTLFDSLRKTAGGREALESILEKIVGEILTGLREEVSKPEFQFRGLPPLHLPEKPVRFELDEKGIAEWRDRNLANALLELACGSIRAGGTPSEVVLHAGYQHVPGVYSLLKKTIANESVAEKFPVRVDFSGFANPPPEMQAVAKEDRFEFAK